MAYIIQFISALLATMVITKSYADYKKKHEALAVFLFWSTAWLVIVYIAFFPQQVSLISQRVGNKDTSFARILAMGMTFLFYVIYRVFVKAERTERKLSQTIQQLALKDLDEQRSDKKTRRNG